MNSITETLKLFDLKKEQTQTLLAPRRKYGILARILFKTMDLLYGKQRTFSKFKVLEIIARMPYQSWENVAYVAMTHMYWKPKFARRIFEYAQEAREQQDNEQWHLLILEELTREKEIAENFFLIRVIPQLIAFIYYHISWLLYVFKPSWSYGLNADFEDHAEHEYMEFVQEDPDLDQQIFHSQFEKDYGRFNSLGDLFRRIALDERQHKNESIERMKFPRFA